MKIYSLFEQIELLIPDIVLAKIGKSALDEIFGYSIFDEINENIDAEGFLSAFEEVKEKCGKAKTQTAKLRIIDRANEKLFLNGSSE